jgi:hypothetical protein
MREYIMGKEEKNSLLLISGDTKMLEEMKQKV